YHRAFGRQQGPIDQAVVPRLDQIVGEQALEAVEGSGATAPETRGVGGDHDRPVTHLRQAATVQGQIELRHEPMVTGPLPGPRSLATRAPPHDRASRGEMWSAWRIASQRPVRPGDQE